MRKNVILFGMLLSMVCGMSIQAQTKASVGLRLDAGVTNIKLTKIPGAGHTWKPTASVGTFTRVDFSDHFALQPELLFKYTESNVRIEGEKTKFKYAGVEIPVYAMGKIQTENGTLFLGIGPHIGYGFSIDSNIEHIHHEISYKKAIELDHWYAGGSVMAGYEFRNKISVAATYKVGSDIGSSSNSADMETHSVTLGIGYRF